MDGKTNAVTNMTNGGHVKEDSDVVQHCSLDLSTPRLVQWTGSLMRTFQYPSDMLVVEEPQDIPYISQIHYHLGTPSEIVARSLEHFATVNKDEAVDITGYYEHVASVRRGEEEEEEEAEEKEEDEGSVEMDRTVAPRSSFAATKDTTRHVDEGKSDDIDQAALERFMDLMLHRPTCLWGYCLSADGRARHRLKEEVRNERKGSVWERTQKKIFGG